MKRYWTGIAIALGSLTVVATFVWEMARTKPDYRFLVEPWAIKGYDSVHGWVFVSIGLALLAGGMIVLTEWSTGKIGRYVSLGYFVAAGTAIALAFASEPQTVTLAPVMGLLVAVFLTLIVFRFSKELLIRSASIFRNTWVRLLTGVAMFAVVYLVMRATVIGKELELDTPIWIFILMAVLALYALAAVPRGLAADRMLIYSTMLAMVVIVTSAGALRSTLIRLQVEAQGVSAEFRDTQAGLGWFLAVFALVVVFVGAVGLWARRRDLLIASDRARRQRAAAEKSAAEIKAAEEAYLASVQASRTEVQES